MRARSVRLNAMLSTFLLLVERTVDISEDNKITL